MSSDFKLHCIAKAEIGSLPRSSPAAGLTTVDPLPMREDAWSEEEAEDYSTNLRQPKPLQKQQTSHRHKAAVPPPANRIQGTMRNPEFQHNGTVPFSIHSHRSGCSHGNLIMKGLTVAAFMNSHRAWSHLCTLEANILVCATKISLYLIEDHQSIQGKNYKHAIETWLSHLPAEGVEGG